MSVCLTSSCYVARCQPQLIMLPQRGENVRFLNADQNKNPTAQTLYLSKVEYKTKIEIKKREIYIIKIEPCSMAVLIIV